MLSGKSASIGNVLLFSLHVLFRKLLVSILSVYPWIANYLNEHAAKSTISTYENEVNHTDKKEKEEMLEKAREYNEKLASSHVVLTDPFSEETNGRISEKEYYQLLNLDNTGVMCSLEIPSINVDLPVYHGTSNSVLEKGVGGPPFASNFKVYSFDQDAVTVRSPLQRVTDVTAFLLELYHPLK